MSQRIRRQRVRDTFLLSGWLFADLLLGLMIIFMVSAPPPPPANTLPYGDGGSLFANAICMPNANQHPNTNQHPTRGNMWTGPEQLTHN